MKSLENKNILKNVLYKMRRGATRMSQAAPEAGTSRKRSPSWGHTQGQLHLRPTTAT